MHYVLNRPITVVISTGNLKTVLFLLPQPIGFQSLVRF